MKPMQLCLIMNQQMHESLLTDSMTELFLPLCKWTPAKIADAHLHLPGDWRVSREGAAFSAGIPLDREGNYTLACDSENALMMVRNASPEAILTVDVLTTDRFTVGRSRSNALCCRDGHLSSFHGVFSYDRDGVLWYADESTNGTFINGELVHGDKRALKTGDQLDFPPQMRVIVNGCTLNVRCPAEHSKIELPALPAEDGDALAALYVQPAGKLRHLRVPHGTDTVQAFFALAGAQLDAGDQAYLSPAAVLRDAETRAIIDDSALGTTLGKRYPTLLLT